MHVFCELCGRKDTSTIKQNPDYCSQRKHIKSTWFAFLYSDFFPLFVIKVIITLERNTRTYRNIYCIQENPEAALDEEFHLQNCLTEISLKPERMLIRVCMFKV